MKYISILFIAFMMMITSSCLKTSESQATKDDNIIQDYIKAKNLTAIKHSSGLYYVIKTEGSGVNPTLANTVSVYYNGYFTNGTVFDGTNTSPATFPLSNLIAGWQIGIPLIKKGGEIKLLIPSALGYGSQARQSIPANSVLIFDIKLADIK